MVRKDIHAGDIPEDTVKLDGLGRHLVRRQAYRSDEVRVGRLRDEANEPIPRDGVGQESGGDCVELARTFVSDLAKHPAAEIDRFGDICDRQSPDRAGTTHGFVSQAS